MTAQGPANGDTKLATVAEIIDEARALGYVGPPASSEHIDHSRGFLEAARLAAPWLLDKAVARTSQVRVLDLGSGGGLPGLVILAIWTSAHVTFLDSSTKRCDFVRNAVERLGVGARASVVGARAEEAGRHQELRASFDIVVARSFGPPPVTAECGAPFLRVGGILVVSEPPTSTRSHRWPAEHLAKLGLEPLDGVPLRYAYQVLRKVGVCPDTYPRRTGVPAKRPLYLVRDG
ncbi:MAG: RsmG family class I SAM-dependent methyltransferase [Acidimicrobiales bacterium]|jgi:16S rRNA (guanine527-N7)-methyltransferase